MTNYFTRNVVDLTQSDDSYMWNEDPCYAFKMDYVFSDVIPMMTKLWEREASAFSRISGASNNNNAMRIAEGSVGINESNAPTLSFDGPSGKRSVEDIHDVTSFPYSRSEVMWALTNYADAYGAVYMQGTAFFKRCGCVDSNGKRHPCVPPKKGYMCSTISFILKKKIVLQKEKERRVWEIHKKAAILEAGLRAEAEATRYLESEEGTLWVAELSYEMTENRTEEHALENVVSWRRAECEKKKQKVIKAFNKKKEKFEESLFKKTISIQRDIDEAKEILKSASQGYIRESATTRLLELSGKMAEFPEHAKLLELQNECEMECLNIENDFFNEDESNVIEDVDEDVELNETDEERKARLIEEKAKAIRVRTATADGRTSMASRHAQQTADKKSRDEKALKARLARERKRKKYMQAIKHEYRYLKDQVTMKYKHVKLLFSGEFSEIQQELQAHIIADYINSNVALARRTAEREYDLMERIRLQWGGLGLEISFW
jgi:hypothetical protein